MTELEAYLIDHNRMQIDLLDFMVNRDDRERDEQSILSIHCLSATIDDAVGIAHLDDSPLSDDARVELLKLANKADGIVKTFAISQTK